MPGLTLTLEKKKGKSNGDKKPRKNNLVQLYNSVLFAGLEDSCSTNFHFKKRQFVAGRPALLDDRYVYR
jgi:hypothetical protein